MQFVAGSVRVRSISFQSAAGGRGLFVDLEDCVGVKRRVDSCDKHAVRVHLTQTFESIQAEGRLLFVCRDENRFR